MLVERFLYAMSDLHFLDLRLLHQRLQARNRGLCVLHLLLVEDFTLPVTAMDFDKQITCSKSLLRTCAQDSLEGSPYAGTVRQ